MAPIEYCIILKYHLMILVFHIDEVSTVFHNACLDTLGNSKSIVGSFHVSNNDMNLLKMFYLTYFDELGVFVKKEEHVNFLIDPY